LRLKQLLQLQRHAYKNLAFNPGLGLPCARSKISRAAAILVIACLPCLASLKSSATSLYGAFFVKGYPKGSYPFFNPVSLFDLGSPFLHPDPRWMAPARAGAVKDGA
jgi:hypothetical protein